MSKIISNPELLQNYNFIYSPDLKIKKQLTSIEARKIINSIINFLEQDRKNFNNTFNQDHILFLKDFILNSPKIERQTKYQKALIVNHPGFSIEEKTELLKKVQSGKHSNLFKEKTVIAEICSFLTPSGLNFIKTKAHFSDIKKAISKKNLEPALCFERHNEPVVYYEMFFKSKLSKTLKLKEKERIIFDLSCCSLANLSHHFSKEEILSCFTKAINKTIEHKRASFLLGDSYRNHSELYNIILKKTYNHPLLDLLPNLYELAVGRCEINFIKEEIGKYSGIKEYLKDKAGFCSSALINYIKKESSELNSPSQIIEFLFFCKEHLKDHNLTWQAFKSNWKQLSTHDLVFMGKIFKVNNFLNTYQMIKLIQNIELSEGPFHNRTISDTCRLLGIEHSTESSIDLSKNKTFNSLKENYRFNDYNSFEKLHDILSLLYTKEKTKKLELEVLEKFPSLAQIDNSSLESGGTIIVAKTNYDLIEWGQKLRICIGSYANVALTGECILLGITVDSKIKYCVEIVNSHSDIRITQFNGLGNSRAPQSVINEFKKEFDKIKKSLSEEWALFFKDANARILRMVEDAKEHLDYLAKQAVSENDETTSLAIRQVQMMISDIGKDADSGRFIDRHVITQLKNIQRMTLDDFYMQGIYTGIGRGNILYPRYF